MSEHTPAPTPSRSVYGFVLYLCSQMFFILYFIWAVTPESWFVAMNITYLPKRYWAVSIPVFLLTILATFAFIIYPSLNLCMTPRIDDVRTIKEPTNRRKNVSEAEAASHSEKAAYTYCCCKSKENCSLYDFNKLNRNEVKYSVPMVDDLCIGDVSRTLYLK